MQLKNHKRLDFDYNDARVIDIECFPQQAAPVAVDMLLRRLYSSSWEPDQWEDGQDMIARCIMSIYAGCISPTAKSVDRVYRLLDTHLTGQVYTWEADPDTGEIQVSPSIPPVPTPTGNRPIMYALDWADKRLDNSLNGTSYNGMPTQPGIAAQLQLILEAIQQGEQDPEDIAQIIQLLGQIALLLA